MKFRRIHFLFCFLGLVLCMLPFRSALRLVASGFPGISYGRKTTSDRLKEFGESVRNRWATKFEQIGVSYPPKRITLVGLKQERLLELWVAGETGEFRLLETFPILAASGKLGPKLAEGDGQVPEGLYKIESLNPNSLFHLALRVNYPNNFDKVQGELDGRSDLGSDIMIHGGFSSIGCLAMGDQAAEDLFILTAEAGIEHVSVILSPADFRVRELPADLPPMPPWTAKLYEQIKSELLKTKITQ